MSRSEPIVWRTEKRKLRELVEWEKNPRELTRKQADDLKQSLEKFGYVEEIVLNADGHSMIGGHQRRRVMMAQALVDPESEVDVRIPSRQLSAKEAEELAIRLNLNQGQWDWDKLGNDFDEQELIDWGFEPAQLGMEDAAPAGSATASTPTEGDAPIEVFDENVRVKLGETWLIGTKGSRIICGDSTDPQVVSNVMGRDQIDFVFTSPPYNVNINYSEHEDSGTIEEYLAFLHRVGSAFLPHMPDGRCVGWNIGTSRKTAPHRQFGMLEEMGLMYQRLLIWKKVGVPLPNFQHTRNDPRARRLTPHYQHEVIGLFSKGDIQYGDAVEFDETLQADVFEVMQTQATSDLPDADPTGAPRAHGGLSRHSLKVHPAAFPMKLPASFIQHLADVGKVVFDPFMGSGTTLLAAESLERIGIGAEKDPRYCEVILQRAERLGYPVLKVEDPDGPQDPS